MKDYEPLLERGQRERVRVDEGRIQQLVRGFATDWKHSIESINQDIMHSFSNFKTGTYILQVSNLYIDIHVYTYMYPHMQGALSQLIQYYHRFQKVLSQPPFKSLTIRGELINIHHIMVEVKRHRTTF